MSGSIFTDESTHNDNLEGHSLTHSPLTTNSFAGTLPPTQLESVRTDLQRASSDLEVAVHGKESVEEERNVAQAVAAELREKLDAAEDDLREVCGCVQIVCVCAWVGG